MHIVDVHDVGIDLPDLPDQLLGGAARSQSVGVEKPGGEPVKQEVEFVPDGHELRTVRGHAVPRPAVGDVTLPAGRLREFAEFAHDLAGGGILPDDGVDLQQPFHLYFPPTKMLVILGSSLRIPP